MWEEITRSTGGEKKKGTGLEGRKENKEGEEKK